MYVFDILLLSHRFIEATGEEGKEAVFAEVLKNVKDIHVVSAPKHIE